MNTKTHELYNSWFHESLTDFIYQSDDKEDFKNLLLEKVKSLESRLTEHGADVVEALQMTAHVTKMLDEALEDERITDEVIQWGGYRKAVIKIIYNKVCTPPRMKPSKSANSVMNN
jgi:hypothetical protein